MDLMANEDEQLGCLVFDTDHENYVHQNLSYMLI